MWSGDKAATGHYSVIWKAYQVFPPYVIVLLSPSLPHSLLSPSYPLPLLIKAVGLLVNLTQGGSSDWSVVMEETALLAALGTLLLSNSDPGSGCVVEQCLCVLVNLSCCSEKTRRQLVHSEDIIRAVGSLLVYITSVSGIWRDIS